MQFFKLLLTVVLFSYSGPVVGSEKSSFYTVDMNTLLKQTVVGKKLISDKKKMVLKQLWLNKIESFLY